MLTDTACPGQSPRSRSKASCHRLTPGSASRRLTSHRGAGLAIALAALAGQAQAQVSIPPDFTADQQVTVNGEYLPPGSFETQPFSDSYTGNSLGSSEYDFSSQPGITQGKVTWNNQIDAQGFIRTSSELTINHTFGDEDFTKLTVDASNTVSYFDFLKVRDVAPPGSPEVVPFDQPYIIRFQTHLSGNLTSTVNYSDPSIDGAGKATYQSTVQYSGRIASTSGDADTPFDIGDTFSDNAGFPFGANVDESDTISVNVFFQDQTFRLDDGVFFGFDYTDSFSVDIGGIDAGSIDITMTNDLGSTVITTASIFDLDGNLMPTLRAYSEQYDYELAPNPVPLPAAAWLFGSALLGLGWIRRRQR